MPKAKYRTKPVNYYPGGKRQTTFEFAGPWGVESDRVFLYQLQSYNEQDTDTTWKLLNTVWLDSEGKPIG